MKFASLNQLFVDYLIADHPEQEKKLHLSADGSTLYGVERRRCGGDLLKQFDLDNMGGTKSVQQLHGLQVRWLELLSNDRWA